MCALCLLSCQYLAPPHERLPQDLRLTEAVTTIQAQDAEYQIIVREKENHGSFRVQTDISGINRRRMIPTTATFFVALYALRLKSSDNPSYAIDCVLPANEYWLHQFSLPCAAAAESPKKVSMHCSLILTCSRYRDGAGLSATMTPSPPISPLDGLDHPRYDSVAFV